MASLEYVTAGWLRSRRLTVASVGAGRGCGGLCPRPLPRQGGGLGVGDFLPVCGRLGRRGGGRPWLHSGGSSPDNQARWAGAWGGEASVSGVLERQGEDVDLWWWWG